MKRGLVILDPAENAHTAFNARIGMVRDRLRDVGARVALIYGDVSRSGDISYLTNLSLYWNEAILAVPLMGPPSLITKLSKRVQPWMRTTTILEDIRSGPRMAENLGKFMDERHLGCDGSIAVVDMHWWPNNLITQVRAALPEASLMNLRGAVRDHRLVPSREEIAFLQSGSRLMREALEKAWNESKSAHERTSVAVRHVRRAGFQDATVHCANLSDGSEYADVIGQFRCVWLRQSHPRGGPLAEASVNALGAALTAAKAGTSEAHLKRVAANGVGAGFDTVFSCMPHADVETRGLYRSREDAQRALKEGEVVCMTATVNGEAGVVTAAETVQVTRQGVRTFFQERV